MSRTPTLDECRDWLLTCQFESAHKIDLKNKDAQAFISTLVRVCNDHAALAADATRYRKVRAARNYVGMLEFAVATAINDAEYDAAVDRLPVSR